MARGNTLDRLQAFRFHLVDVAPLTPPEIIPLFLPQAGFSSITAPELTMNIENFVEGNSYFGRKVVKDVEVSAITLSRGATFIDSDFWRWFRTAMIGPVPSLGGVRPRRNLLLIQFMQMSLEAGAKAAALGAAGVAEIAGASAEAAARLGVSAGIFAATGNVWRVSAKAWMLWNCIPSRWKAGSDFDATSSEVSIAEIDIEPEFVDEIALGSG